MQRIQARRGGINQRHGIDRSPHEPCIDACLTGKQSNRSGQWHSPSSV
ncbi:MAG: hypothetical protein ACI9WU_000218 [Myxococcota bacterium]|jgi:hypothetical protein